MNESTSPGERLDSWKAIADYLQRDIATVRRWEKSLALPIHRVGGTGRSVFANTIEIDEWLNRAKPLLPIVEAAVPPVAMLSSRRAGWRWVALAAGVLAVVAFLSRARVTDARDLHIEVTPAGVIARDSAGAEQWRHPFPPEYKTIVEVGPTQILDGPRAGVYVATNYRQRQTEDQIESGDLMLFDSRGNLRRSFSFGDVVTFMGKPYGPPWDLTAFSVNRSGGVGSLAVVAHHYVWDPGVVTVLDDQWKRRGTFVHAGWIEDVRWLGPDRLVVAGFSNAHDGGMIALLDAAALDGQGPEPAGSPHFCETCGPNRPLRMYVFPRTEVNRASASPFNRALIQTFAGGTLNARTVEMSSAGGKDDADVIYEFATPALDLVSAKFSERYWEMHRALEAEGKITHTRAQSPDRDGPREIQMWEPATGWRTLQISK